LYLIICTIPKKHLFVSLLNYSGLWLKTQGRKASRRKQGVALLSPRRKQRTATPTAQGFAGLLRMATKLQFRGCSNFNLADLGVADFFADFAGYSGKYVVLCCAWKGGFLCRKNC